MAPRSFFTASQSLLRVEDRGLWDSMEFVPSSTLSRGTALAQCTAMPSLRRSAKQRVDYIDARGFTLMELMIVVLLVGILSVMALPAMGQAAVDRRVYQDTSQISDLIRAAKARAIGRGAAVLVAMDGTGRGKFNVRE